MSSLTTENPVVITINSNKTVSVECKCYCTRR